MECTTSSILPSFLLNHDFIFALVPEADLSQISIGTYIQASQQVPG